MNKRSINIRYGITLLLLTVPATLGGRLLAELLLSWYSFVTNGRYPVYDALFDTDFGSFIKYFAFEGIILFAGLYATAALSLLPFRKRREEIHFGGFWLLHFLIQTAVLITFAGDTIDHPDQNILILLGSVLLTGGIYWLVYKVFRLVDL